MAKRVLVVGLGNMGMSHALAYTRIPGFEVVGVCERHIDKRELPKPLQGAKRFSKFETALAELKPEVVSINTMPDTHADAPEPGQPDAREHPAELGEERHGDDDEKDD